MNRPSVVDYRDRLLRAALVFGLLSTGCSAPAGKAPDPAQSQPLVSQGQETPSSGAKLAGVQWRLVEIQSMDDSVGPKRPADPAQYTMTLNPDGTVQMKLNCNSAVGKWTAKASQDPASGSFEFGPLAATRALCPPPSLDEEIAAQAQYVRGYLLRDGRLHLSLMADGGILVWEPVSGGSSSGPRQPDREIEAAVLRASPDYTAAAVNVNSETGKGRYAYERFDLNGDGKEEVFVYLLGPFFCGSGGCNLQLLTRGPAGYQLVNEFPISRTPVIVSSAKSNGWSDLWRMESGGGAPATYVRHSFDGRKYVQRERIPAAKPPDGKSVLSGEITFAGGIPLDPPK